MAYKLILEESGWMGDMRRGASMGRPDWLPEDRRAAVKLHLTRMRWVDGDYDEGGAYWGRSFRNNDPRRGYADEWMYCAQSDDRQTRIFVRATEREDAKRQVRELLPNAVFYGCFTDTRRDQDGAWDEGYADAIAGLNRRLFKIHPDHYEDGYMEGVADLLAGRA